MKTRSTAALALLVLVALVVTAWLAGRDGPADIRAEVGQDGVYTVGTLPDEGGRDALEAAVEALPVALSYDHRTLEQGLRNATEMMTRSFGEQFRATFESSAARKATERQAVTKALVSGAGLVRMDGPDRARCLLYVDQAAVAGADADKKKSRPVDVTKNRVLVDMRKVGDTWKVDAIEPF